MSEGTPTIQAIAEQQPQPHTISVADFKKPSQQSTSYSAPDIFNRASFASGIAYSFAISRGDPSVQMAFFDWKRLNQEENIPITLQNFEKAGGINCLTLEEQTVWIAIYRRVKEHATLLKKKEDVYHGDRQKVDREILWKIQSDISNYEHYPNEYGTEPFLSEAEMKGMSWQDFKDRVNQHFATQQQEAVKINL